MIKAKISIYYGKLKHTEEYTGTIEELMEHLRQLRAPNPQAWISYSLEEIDTN